MTLCLIASGIRKLVHVDSIAREKVMTKFSSLSFLRDYSMVEWGKIVVSWKNGKSREKDTYTLTRLQWKSFEDRRMEKQPPHSAGDDRVSGHRK